MSVGSESDLDLRPEADLYLLGEAEREWRGEKDLDLDTITSSKRLDKSPKALFNIMSRLNGFSCHYLNIHDDDL